MSNEATIRSSLSLRKLDANNVTILEYSGRPSGFQADVAGTKGPVPGAITALRTGTIVDFSQLTIPGFCQITSLDSNTGNYVEYGIYDPQINVFYPLGELGVGESYILKLTRNLLEEYIGTGTGTTGPTNKFMVKGFNGNANVFVGAFEK